MTTHEASTWLDEGGQPRPRAACHPRYHLPHAGPTNERQRGSREVDGRWRLIVVEGEGS
jgi:hypothetical protein